MIVAKCLIRAIIPTIRSEIPPVAKAVAVPALAPAATSLEDKLPISFPSIGIEVICFYNIAEIAWPLVIAPLDYPINSAMALDKLAVFSLVLLI